jgi:hypothetical protein
VFTDLKISSEIVSMGEWWSVTRLVVLLVLSWAGGGGAVSEEELQRISDDIREIFQTRVPQPPTPQDCRKYCHQ